MWEPAFYSRMWAVGSGGGVLGAEGGSGEVATSVQS